MIKARLGLVVLLLVSQSACITGRFSRQDDQTPPAPEALAELENSGLSLDRCLQMLGAPLVVRELGDGIELIYGWQRTKGWSTTISLPLVKRGSSSVTYGQARLGAQGLTLRFDGDWVLTGSRRGSLRDLIDSLKPKPTFVGQDEGSEG